MSYIVRNVLLVFCLFSVANSAFASTEPTVESLHVENPSELEDRVDATFHGNRLGKLLTTCRVSYSYPENEKRSQLGMKCNKATLELLLLASDVKAENNIWGASDAASSGQLTSKDILENLEICKKVPFFPFGRCIRSKSVSIWTAFYAIGFAQEGK